MRVVVKDLAVIAAPCPEHHGHFSLDGDRIVALSRVEASPGETVRVQMELVGSMSGHFTGWIEDGQVIVLSVDEGVLDVPTWMDDLVTHLVTLAQSKLEQIPAEVG